MVGSDGSQQLCRSKCRQRSLRGSRIQRQRVVAGEGGGHGGYSSHVAAGGVYDVCNPAGCVSGRVGAVQQEEHGNSGSAGGEGDGKETLDMVVVGGLKRCLSCLVVIRSGSNSQFSIQ